MYFSANEGNIKSLVVEGSGSLYVTIYDALYKQRKQAEPFKIVIESSNNNDSTYFKHSLASSIHCFELQQ
jgi:hypothetical protein